VRRRLGAGRREQRAEDDRVVVLVVSRDDVAVLREQLHAASLGLHAYRGDLFAASRSRGGAIDALLVLRALADLVRARRSFLNRKVVEAHDRIARDPRQCGDREKVARARVSLRLHGYVSQVELEKRAAFERGTARWSRFYWIALRAS